MAQHQQDRRSYARESEEGHIHDGMLLPFSTGQHLSKTGNHRGPHQEQQHERTLAKGRLRREGELIACVQSQCVESQRAEQEATDHIPDPRRQSGHGLVGDRLISVEPAFGTAADVHPEQGDDDHEDGEYIQRLAGCVFLSQGQAAAQQPRDSQSNREAHEQSEGLLGDLPLHHPVPRRKGPPFHADGMADEHRQGEGQSTTEDAVPREEQGGAVARAHKVHQQGEEDAEHPAPAFAAIGRAELESAEFRKAEIARDPRNSAPDKEQGLAALIGAQQGVDPANHEGNDRREEIAIIEVLRDETFVAVADVVVEEKEEVDRKKSRRKGDEGPHKAIQRGARQREGQPQNRAANPGPERAEKEKHGVAVEHVGKGVTHGVHGLLHVAQGAAPGPADGPAEPGHRAAAKPVRATGGQAQREPQQRPRHHSATFMAHNTPIAPAIGHDECGEEIEGGEI